MDSTRSSLNLIDSLLTDAQKYRLEAEVVYWALKYMQENPTLTIDDAIIMGYEEWIR